MLSDLRKPPALRPGDRVAAVSLSWGGPGTFPHRYEAGVRQLEAELGLMVVPMPHVLVEPDVLAADPEARADDLHRALVDPGIRGIISTIGGDDSIRILPFLDLGLLATNPKVFLGYSDSTATHMAFLRAGVGSFYGPAVMTGFAENGGMHAYTEDGVRAVLMAPGTPGLWPENADGWTKGFLDWADPTNQDRRRALLPSVGWRWLGGESSEGPIVAACLESLDWLRGTRWWPDLEGAVLAVETSEEQPAPAIVARSLRSLAATGDLARLRGILFGRPGGSDLDPADHVLYDDAIVSVVREEQGLLTLPIVTGMDFGHTDPVWTIPQGIPTRIDTEMRTIRFLESGVSSAEA